MYTHEPCLHNGNGTLTMFYLKKKKEEKGINDYIGGLSMLCVFEWLYI